MSIPTGHILLFTIGHGTMTATELTRLLKDPGVEAVIDVRSAPGSRRNPQFSRDQLETWMPASGLSYRWEPDLGGFRRALPDSPNIALRHPSFRGYADYMRSQAFATALGRALQQARTVPTSLMCAETLWWRCHRRLIADAAVLSFGADVVHIGHDGRLQAHQVTPGARLDPASVEVVYDLQDSGAC